MFRHQQFYISYYYYILMKKRSIFLMLSMSFFFLGIFFFFRLRNTVVGNIISQSERSSLFLYPFFGFLFIILSAFFLILSYAVLEKLILTSALESHPRLLRLAEEARRSERVKRELDHLRKELGKGNLEAGLGHPGHIQNTPVSYLRGRNGGKLYFRRTQHGYEIVGESGKERNQEQVIRALEETYLN